MNEVCGSRTGSFEFRDPRSSITGEVAVVLSASADQCYSKAAIVHERCTDRTRGTSHITVQRLCNEQCFACKSRWTILCGNEGHSCIEAARWDIAEGDSRESGLCAARRGGKIRGERFQGTNLGTISLSFNTLDLVA